MQSLSISLFIIASMAVSVAFAAPEPSKGFVTVEQGHEVYVEHHAAARNKPTVVLVNGLVYDLKRWDPYVAKLKAKGIGVVRYNFRGQSKTLLREVESKSTPEFFARGITYQNLAQELAQVLDSAKVSGKVTVVGLSYGAAIAAEFANVYPQRVDNLILMAPLVISLDHYDPMGAWIRWNLDAIRLWWGPIWGPAAFDFYYDAIYRSYLVDQRLTPERIPEEMHAIAGVYKESIFHQVRAVRDFNLKSYSFKNGPRTHLLLASEEDRLAFADQLRAWEAWDPTARGSLVYIEESSHAIPDAAPETAARLTLQILGGEKNWSEGRLYRANAAGTKECENIAALKKNSCD